MFRFLDKQFGRDYNLGDVGEARVGCPRYWGMVTNLLYCVVEMFFLGQDKAHGVRS